MSSYLGLFVQNFVFFRFFYMVFF